MAAVEIMIGSEVKEAVVSEKVSGVEEVMALEAATSTSFFPNQIWQQKHNFLNDYSFIP